MRLHEHGQGRQRVVGRIGWEHLALELVDEPLDYRPQQVLLGREVEVHESAADARLLADRGDGAGRVAVPGKQPHRRLEEAVARRGRLLGSLGRNGHG